MSSQYSRSYLNFVDFPGLIDPMHDQSSHTFETPAPSAVHNAFGPLSLAGRMGSGRATPSSTYPPSFPHLTRRNRNRHSPLVLPWDTKSFLLQPQSSIVPPIAVEVGSHSGQLPHLQHLHFITRGADPSIAGSQRLLCRPGTSSQSMNQ